MAETLPAPGSRCNSKTQIQLEISLKMIASSGFSNSNEIREIYHNFYEKLTSTYQQRIIPPQKFFELTEN